MLAKKLTSNPDRALRPDPTSHTMLVLDGIGRACNYTLDTFRSLTSEQINGLSFVSLECCGIAALDDLIPKSAKFRQPPRAGLTGAFPTGEQEAATTQSSDDGRPECIKQQPAPTAGL